MPHASSCFALGQVQSRAERSVQGTPVRHEELRPEALEGHGGCRAMDGEASENFSVG